MQIDRTEGSFRYESTQMCFGNLLAAVAYPDQYLRRDSKLRNILWPYFSSGHFVSLYPFCADFLQDLSGDREQKYRKRSIGAILFCSEK